MAKSSKIHLKYDINDIVENDINDEGCKHLAQSNWPLLNHINLCKIYIF